jgi:hypothetical protein
MSSNYPIVESHSLDPVSRRGPFNLRGPIRGVSELPRPDAHQVLVYRVDGSYLEDNASLRRDDERVTNASHVSLVDLRHNTEVSVSFKIPSQDASEFTLVVSFVCTVTDAVTVVREGLTDAGALLNAYLRGHPQIFEMGLSRTMSEVNEVRRDARAEVLSYTLVSPPLVSGMRVDFVNVEVMTPKEIEELEAQRRGKTQSHVLRSHERKLDSEFQKETVDSDQDLRVRRQQYEDDLEVRRRAAEERAAKDRQRHEQGLQYQEAVFRRLQEDDELLHSQGLDEKRDAVRRAVERTELHHDQQRGFERQEYESEFDTRRRLAEARAAKDRQEWEQEFKYKEAVFRRLQEDDELLHGQGLEEKRAAARRAVEQSDLRHEQELGFKRQEYDQLSSAEKARHDLEIERIRRRFVRDEFQAAREVVGGDYLEQYRLAAEAGEITQKEYAEIAAAVANREWEADQRRLDEDRRAEERDAEWNREKEKLDSAQIKAERDRRAQWDRDDQLRREQTLTENERHRLEVNLRVVRDLAARGAFDMTNLNTYLERLLNGVIDTTPETSDPSKTVDSVRVSSAELEGDGPAAIDVPATPQLDSAKTPDAPGDSADVREEDEGF